jgi:lysophospholipase L1-like esterase
MIKSKENITIDFIGDSITWGTMHCSQEETYVARFTHYLAEYFKEYTVRRYDGIPIAGSAEPMKCFEGPFVYQYGENKATIDVIKNRIGGSTVKKASERPQDYTKELANGRRHDFVFLMFGINDALTYDKGKYVTGLQFKEDYKKLLDIIKNDNPYATPVITSTTKPTILTNRRYPQYVPEVGGILVCNIEEHVECVKKLAIEEDIAYIDTHKLWQEHWREGEIHYGHGDWLVGEDSCHPSPVASDEMAKFVFNKFIELAKEGKI